MGTLNPDLYDFSDYAHKHDNHEDWSDIVEQKIFKYKYRQNADDTFTYERRQKRVIDRFFERAAHRDPALEQDLRVLFEKGDRHFSLAQLVNDPSQFSNVAGNETRVFREYIVEESSKQYKDYYESDDEENEFFEFLDNYQSRDQIRMMEIFEDFSVNKFDKKEFFTIAKREHNPQLSLVGNMMLDLIDFKDRVTPLSNDIAMLEQTRRFQKFQPDPQQLTIRDEIINDLNQQRAAEGKKPITQYDLRREYPDMAETFDTLGPDYEFPPEGHESDQLNSTEEQMRVSDGSDRSDLDLSSKEDVPVQDDEQVDPNILVSSDDEHKKD